MKNNYIIQAWLVLILAICYGGALASIQLTLAPIISENKINETREKVPELVFGMKKALDMASKGETLDIEPTMVSVDKGDKKISYSVFKAMDKGNVTGWVAKSSGQGYADKIELLIGLDPKVQKITGLFILDQKETPGLGNKIIDWDWRKQFVKKNTDKSLTVVKTGAKLPNDIDSITGATISSRSVCSIINTAVKDLKGPLTEK